MTFSEYVQQHLKKPFAWGTNDCVLFAINWASMRTGRDYLEGIPRWTSQKTALRSIEFVGGLAAAMDERFKKVNKNFAKDGDIAYYNGGLCLFSGPYIIGPSDEGLARVDRTKAECAWTY